MFTGLVQAVGTVLSIVPGPTGARLTIDPGPRRAWPYRAAAGDSVAVSGCCLTVASRPARAGAPLEFDVVHETLAKTRLGSLRPGDRVNLEHAATPTTLMGGHLVQGHVDGVGRVASVQGGDDWRVRVELPPPPRPPHPPRPRSATPAAGGGLAQYIVPKGSVCVDGVSLTVAEVWAGDGRAGDGGAGDGGGGGGGGGGFTVALIPVTLAKTTLAGLKPGDAVNLEVDLIVKTVVHWLSALGPSAFPAGPAAVEAPGLNTKARRPRRKAGTAKAGRP